MGETMFQANFSRQLRRTVMCLILLLAALCAPAAQAQSRLIVRDSLGLPSLNLTCLLAGCQVVTGLGDPNGQLFVVIFPSILNPVTALLQLNRPAQTQSAFNVAGAGVTVAVIDTGVDPNNAVLHNVLVTGYDFTRNISGGSEMNDVQATPNLSGATTAPVRPRQVAGRH